MQKVLIVDDSELITRVLSFMVADELGFEAVVAASYKETEEQLARHQGEIFTAVVDLNLPDATDGQAVDLVMQHQIPSIVLSATYDESIRQQVLSKGIVDYLVKEGRYSYDYAIRFIRRLYRNQFVKTLVVDDSATSRALIRSQLELFNLPVMEAEDGREGFQLLNEHPDIQMVVTDYEMPNLDGFELVKKLRKSRSYSELIIIGLSASRMETVSAKFIKSGANDFLHKPFSFEELQCRIMQNLETMDHICEIRRAANQDYLTGLNNRRYFFEKGEDTIKSANRKKQPLAAAIMDLDFFKKVNDTYGHDVGDAVLVHVADIIRKFPEDVITARLGGEEFGMLFVDRTIDDVLQLLEEFRQQVASIPVVCGGHRVHISLSIGVTEQGEGLDEMIKIADQGLYQAKEKGRNQVITA
ncbi:MAG: diguanylate cyclase [Motiliproteus sp.]|nr:diguanylate cyclase [Motiliproteus sp.]MCW9050720.1 diguanylate cyclase [Motiliproteus sp.]